MKRQKNKKISNNKLTKKANEKRKKVAFNFIKKETYGNNGNNYYENNYEPFNPEPVVRVSYVPYGQTENNVLEIANTARNLVRELEVENKFTDMFGGITLANLVKNVLDENISNNPIEVQEQLDDVIKVLGGKAATNIQTKYRGKKARINFNTWKRKKESSKMLKKSIRKLRSTANVHRIKQRNEVKKAREKARVVEKLDQHLLDMLNKRRKKLARMASAATKVQTTQRRRLAQMQATQRKKLASAATTVQASQRKRLALAKRRRLAEQEQQRKRAEEERMRRQAEFNAAERLRVRRLEIETDMRIQAAENNANIERVKRERSQRGVMIRNEKRRERIDREIRAAQRAEEWRLAQEAAAAVAGAAMTKGSEYVETMRARGAAGTDAVKQQGKSIMEVSAPLMSWVKDKAAEAGKWHVDYQAERAERKKQEKIESDAKKKRNNATRKVRNNKLRRIERSKEAQEIRIQKNYILGELEEIKGLNTEIRAKMRQLNRLGPYERWMAYINNKDLHETTARIKGRPNTDPPIPERNLVNWAKKKYGNLNLSGLITEIKRRPPISRSEVEREIQEMKQRKQTKSSLQQRLRELNDMYKRLFV